MTPAGRWCGGGQMKDQHPSFSSFFSPFPVCSQCLPFWRPLWWDPLFCFLLFVRAAWQLWQLSSWEGVFLLTSVTEEVGRSGGQLMGGMLYSFYVGLLIYGPKLKPCSIKAAFLCNPRIMWKQNRHTVKLMLPDKEMDTSGDFCY